MMHTTVGRLLGERAREQGSNDYVVCDRDRLTYAAAEERSRALARGLLAAGVGRGSRIGMLFPTGVDFIVTWLGIVRVGATAVPISTFSTSLEIRELASGSDMTMLLGVADYRGHDYVRALGDAFDVDLHGPGEIFTPDAPWLRRIHLHGIDDRVHAAHRIAALYEEGEAIDEALLDAVEADVHPDDRMVMVHTSGSTSSPKGVIHGHGALLTHLDNLNQLRGLTRGVRLFSNSPLFWIGGIGYNLVGTLVAGATLLCSASLDPEETLDFVERERPELVNGFVQSIAHLISHPSFAGRDFSSIRSGNLYPIMPDGVRPADPELRHNMLGMTEAGSVCLMSPDESDQPERYRGSFGRPVPELEARVVEPESTTVCAPGEAGELWLRGPLLMEGYYGRERAQVFTPDEWYRTGDVFSVDADGFFYFRGRRSDMIKTGGANVSPREVEAALRDLIGGLVPIVLGLPDPERDQIVAGVIVAPSDVDLDIPALMEALRARLSAYKVPRKLIRMTPDELPMLSSGKPDMKRLMEVVGGR